MTKPRRRKKGPRKYRHKPQPTERDYEADGFVRLAASIATGECIGFVGIAVMRRTLEAPQPGGVEQVDMYVKRWMAKDWGGAEAVRAMLEGMASGLHHEADNCLAAIAELDGGRPEPSDAN